MTEKMYANANAGHPASLTVIGHWGAYPGPGEATSCYLLRAEGYAVLLDCGSGALTLLQRILPLCQIDAVVLSHYHADHIADLGCLQYASRIDMDLGRRKTPLLVYGHKESPGYQKLSYLEYAKGEGYDASSKIEIGPFVFEFAPMVHPDPSYAIGIRLKSQGAATPKALVYSGDTGASETLVEFSRGAQVLLCETSLYDEYRGRIFGHMSAGEVGETAMRAGVKTLVATHLPHFGDHADLLSQAARAFGGDARLAGTYMTLGLGSF
jgi:ribonuclease BN (tRNA processing enzyme)